MNPILTNKFRDTLGPKIPEQALSYCTELWLTQPFDFKITRTRNTCLGNYRFYKGRHAITVNHDLNVYNFLITFIHEVAHLQVQSNYGNHGRKVMPHGKEWKLAFQKLMIPLLNEKTFPLDVLKPLATHLINPKASSTRDPQLLKALRSHNKGEIKLLTLGEVSINSRFSFKKRQFIKLQNRRTRALCQCLETELKYTLSLAAEITPLK